jgi:hypothetical protein
MDNKLPKGFDMAEETIEKVLKEDCNIFDEEIIKKVKTKITAAFLLGMLMEVAFSKTDKPEPPKTDFNPFGGGLF